MAIRLFHAAQQASTMAAQLSRPRLESLFWRRCCQRFSTGLSSGLYGVRGIGKPSGGPFSPRTRQEGGVLRDDQALRAVPAGSIEDEDGMGPGGDMPADLGEMGTHRLGIGGRHDACGAGGTGRADVTKDAGRGMAAVLGRARTGALAGPEPRQRPPLADPRVRHGPRTDGGHMANSWNHSSSGLSCAASGSAARTRSAKSCVSRPGLGIALRMARAR